MGLMSMIAGMSRYTSRDYAEMAGQNIRSILQRIEPSVEKRLRSCTESFSELGFLMLIAYQLEDLIPYSAENVHFSADKLGVDIGDTFEFGGASFFAAQSELLDLGVVAEIADLDDMGADEAEWDVAELDDAENWTSQEEDAAADQFWLV